jgi:hypothetical protein
MTGLGWFRALSVSYIAISLARMTPVLHPDQPPGDPLQPPRLVGITVEPAHSIAVITSRITCFNSRRLSIVNSMTGRERDFRIVAAVKMTR